MKAIDFAQARAQAKDAERSAAVAAAIERKAAKAAKTYSRAEVSHRVWRSSAIAWAFGLACGSALTVALGWLIYERSSETTARQAMETFARGVAVGQVVGEDDGTDQGVARPGREPRSAP